MKTVAYTLLNVINNSLAQDTNYAIARFMLEKPEKLQTMSLERMADECGVSVSTLNRFCRAIGFQNYSTLREIANIDETTLDITLPSDEYSISKDELRNRLFENFKSIDATERYLYRNVCESIRSAGRIFIIGHGDTQYSALYFQRKMFDHGRLMTVFFAEPAAITKLSTNEDDLLIIISITGGFLKYYRNYVKNSAANKILIGNADADYFKYKIPCGIYTNHALRKYSVMHVFERILDEYTKGN